MSTHIMIFRVENRRKFAKRRCVTRILYYKIIIRDYFRIPNTSVMFIEKRRALLERLVF